METNEFILIKWSNQYSVDIEEIDLQHKQLVNMINRLFSAFKKGEAQKLAGNIVQEMISYASVHFKTEEKYFKLCNFSGAEAHIKEHEDFARKVTQFQNELNTGKALLSYEIMNFLRDWLLNHIKVSDKKYIDCFKSVGAK